MTMACEVRAAVGVDIPNKLFWAAPFCGGFANVLASANDHWQGAFDFRVMYPLKAMSLSSYMVGWPAVFGIYVGNVKADLRNEVSTANERPGWYMGNGERAYSARQAGEQDEGQAVSYINYGVSGLNNIGQTMPDPIRLEFQYQRFGSDLNQGNHTGDVLVFLLFTNIPLNQSVHSNSHKPSISA